MISLLATFAWSAPSMEVIVYGDEFVRWDGTRWWVEDEMVLPSGLLFSVDNNLAIQTHALQVRAIVACEKDARLSGKRWEVSCTFEDVGLLVTTSTQWHPQGQARAQQVLDQIDAELTGAEVQLQVDNEGGITNFDLEGIDADNLRERTHQEALRTVVSQLMAGFHLKIPDQAQRDGQWVEPHTELLDIPSVTASRGSTVVVHQTSDHLGNRLVQTVGRGTIAVGVTWTGDDPFNHTKLVQSDGSDNSAVPTAGGPDGSPPADVIGPVVMLQYPPPGLATPGEASFTTVPRAGEQRMTELEATWSANLSAVALFQRSSGIMTERVWVASATATAGSVEGTGPFLNLGRLHILEPSDKPSVGPTKQVAWPGQPMAGLDPWTDLQGP